MMPFPARMLCRLTWLPPLWSTGLRTTAADDSDDSDDTDDEAADDGFTAADALECYANASDSAERTRRRARQRRTGDVVAIAGDGELWIGEQDSDGRWLKADADAVVDVQAAGPDRDDRDDPGVWSA